MNNNSNKNIWIGVGAVVLIVVIILLVTLTGKKKADTVPVDSTTPTTTTQTTLTKPTSSAPAKSSFHIDFPAAGSVLARGTTYTVSWTGEAKCYDLGYSLNPKQETPYNFVAKVCENNAGVFNYKWLVPPNLTPGTYGLELKNSGATGPGTNSSAFTIK